MRALKFTLSGKTAFFKKPDVNAYLYFTYGQIHKVALLGIVGAVTGLKGYGQQTAEDMFPEFYDRLHNLKVAIRPEAEQGYFNKKVQTYNNSVGYASQHQGGNLIVKEQWLEFPKWTIFILLDHPEGQLIEQHFLSKQFMYYPYLGRNDHFATISDVEMIEVTEATEVEQIDTLFKKSPTIHLTSAFDPFGESKNDWKYEEFLPTALHQETNLYVTEACIFTNMSIETTDVENFYRYENQTLYFL